MGACPPSQIGEIFIICVVKARCFTYNEVCKTLKEGMPELYCDTPLGGGKPWKANGSNISFAILLLLKEKIIVIRKS